MAWLKITDKTGESGYARTENIYAVFSKNGLTRVMLKSGAFIETTDTADDIIKQIEEAEK